MKKLNEYIDYAYLKEDLREKLIERKFLGLMNLNCCHDYENIDYDFDLAAETLILNANWKLNKDNDFYNPKEINPAISRISSTLSFKSEAEVNKRLPSKYGIEDDIFFNKLNYSFFSLLFLDSKIEKRFEIGFILDKNKISAGIAGYSEKLGKELPFYFTYFDDKVLFINPIQGRVMSFSKSKESIMGLTYNGSEVVVVGQENKKIARVSGSEVEFLEEVVAAESDMKSADRHMQREAGKKRKETPWQSVSLGKFKGSNAYMRAHTLITLMVYGIDTLKFALMEANSIMTVDHINAKHDDNRIDNLQLLTRNSNNSKGSKQDDTFYFDYFQYLIA